MERSLTARLHRFKDLNHANVPVARQTLRELPIDPVALEAAEDS